MDNLIWEPYPAIDAPVLFDARQRRRSGSLFVETSQDQNRDPIFTLKDYPYKGMISAYCIYMESMTKRMQRCTWWAAWLTGESS